MQDTRTAFGNYISQKTFDDTDIEWWRYAYWIERQIISCLVKKKNSQSESERYIALNAYHFKVNSGIFFTRNTIDRLTALYDAFKANPRISAKTGNEMIGNPFNDEYDQVSTSVFNATYYNCEFNDIQISTYIEHFARLAILKNVVDYILYKRLGVSERVEKRMFGFGGSTLDFLPQSTKNAIETISKDKFVHLYPVFWQWLIFVFGGFILVDYEEQDYKLLSEKTGIPMSEIPNAFKAYEVLFPMEGGWFNQLSSSNIRFLKMFPVPFHSIGANYRRCKYAQDEDFQELSKRLTGLHTYNDLIKWNNLGYSILSKKY